MQEGDDRHVPGSDRDWHSAMVLAVRGDGTYDVLFVEGICMVWYVVYHGMVCGAWCIYMVCSVGYMPCK